MVRLDAVRSSNAALVQSQPLVAVFVGGTSGIGQYTLEALAATHGATGKGLRVYLIGRKANSAEKIIADCTSKCPNGQFHFVQAGNLALLKDVDQACGDIMRLERAESVREGQEPRVDVLVMSQGQLDFGGRKDTTEGLDITMSLLYYSRMRFTTQLLPLLLTSTLPAHVISVYAAGMEARLFPDDLSLRQPGHYSFLSVRSHVNWMKMIFFEELAARHERKLSLIHVYPSLVMTEAFNSPSIPWFLRLLFTVFKPIMHLAAVPRQECGQRILSLAGADYPAMNKIPEEAMKNQTPMGTDGARGTGAYAANWNGETMQSKPLGNGLSRTDLRSRIWAHTMAAFTQIEKGAVFSA